MKPSLRLTFAVIRLALTGSAWLLLPALASVVRAEQLNLPPAGPPAAVVAWGENSSFQCQLLDYDPLTNLWKIAAGAYHTVVLRSNGTVYAWGGNDFYQTIVPPAAQSGVAAIAAGGFCSMALKTNGAVMVWGDNSFGQTNVPGAAQSGVVAIAAGSSHNLALKTNGSVVAWGDSSLGQTTVPAAAQGGVVAIAAGGYHCVALKTDGSVVAWGYNGYGQTTVPAAAQSGVGAVAAGLFHTVALKTNGSVVAWGWNNLGEASVPVAAQSGVMAIAAAGECNVVLKTNGLVFAWGDYSYGQTTVPVAAQSGVVAIAAGGYHTLALKTNGALVGWGQNWYSETTVPAPAQSDLPANVTAVAAGAYHTVVLKAGGSVVTWGADSGSPMSARGGVTAIAAGAHHTLALKTNGSVVAWGENSYGQTNVPAAVQNQVIALAAGYYHTVVLKTNGSVVAWGYNYFGQTNVPLEATSGVAAIAAAGYHTVALKTNGSVVAWGANYYGETKTNVPLAAQSGVVAIAAGVDHTVALKTNGSVLVWGRNNFGQTNVPVAAQSGVMAVAAGLNHTVALKTDGTVVAWGANNSGQTNVPAGLRNVLGIGAGDAHTVALVLSNFPSGWRFNRGTLALSDLNFAQAGHVFYYDKYGFTGTGTEYGVLAASSAFKPTLSVSNVGTGDLVTQNTNAAQQAQILALFTPAAGQSYVAQLSSSAGEQTGNYELGVYPVVRPGTQANGALTPDDPWVTNHVEAPANLLGPAVVHRKDDYLLTGLTGGDQMEVTVAGSGFDAYLELRELATEAVVASNNNDPWGGINARISFVVQVVSNYLVRVSSYPWESLGSYVLRVDRALYLGQRLRGQLNDLDAVATGGPFRDEYALLPLLSGGEHGVYLRNLSGSTPVVQVVNGQTGAVVSSNDVLSAASEALALFTNAPGITFRAQATTVETRVVADYEVGLYPVVRPGAIVNGQLQSTDRFETNHADRPSPAGPFYFKDHLLWGVSEEQQLEVSLVSTNFDAYLEVLFLDTEVEFRHDNNGGSGLNALISKLAVPANRRFLVRVTSYQPLQTGSYTFAVRLLAPEISSFTPSGGFVGDTVSVSGRYFDTVQYVTFGGGALTVPWLQVETNLLLSVPAGAVSGPISATSPSGTGVSARAFVVWTVPPQLSAAVAGPNGQFGFEVSGAPGGTVLIEGTTNLTPPAIWLPLATNVLSGAGALNFTDETNGGANQRFYRARIAD